MSNFSPVFVSAPECMGTLPSAESQEPTPLSLADTNVLPYRYDTPEERAATEVLPSAEAEYLRESRDAWRTAALCATAALAVQLVCLAYLSLLS